jgi:hypothetical protein
MQTKPLPKLQISARIVDEQGPYMLVISEQPGLCSCGILTAWYVMRVGKVRCFTCDANDTIALIKERAAKLI